MIDDFNETFEQLVLLIGQDNAKKVVAFFEGMSIYFPKRIGLNEQHEQIYAELRSGATYKTLSQKYGYTKSYIRKIEHKKDIERRAARAAMRGKKQAAGLVLPEKLKEQQSREAKLFMKGELFYE
jgi:hypothetical protein